MIESFDHKEHKGHKKSDSDEWPQRTQKVLGDSAV